MSLIDTLKSWYIGKAKLLTHIAIPSERTDRVPGAPIVAGKGYFRLWLAQMFLDRERVLFRKNSPVVHSVVRFQFGSAQGANPAVEIPHVAGPLKLKTELDAINNIIQRNYALTPQMPYHGGIVEVASGLSAVAGKNVATEFLDVMQDFSGMLAVPQLSSVLGIAQPLVKGVQAVANMGEEGLQLGLHDSFGEQSTINPGYFVVIAAPEEKVRKNDLWVINDQLRVGKSKEATQPFTDFSYMVFKIENMSERIDWDFLNTISEPFQKAMELWATDKAQAQASLTVAMMAAWKSPDLVSADRPRVAKAIKEQFEAFKQSVGLSLTNERITLSNAVARVSRSDVAANPPSLAELLK